MCDIRCNLKIEQTAVIRHNLAQHIQYIQRFDYLEPRLICLQQQITTATELPETLLQTLLC